LPAYLADVSGVRPLIGTSDWRRMNRFGKLAIFGASLALQDAGWEVTLNRDDVGLIIASGYGASKSTFDFLDSMLDDDGRCPSPTLFSNSVASSAASHLSIVLQSGGPSLTVSQFEMSPLSALLTASTWMAEGRVKAVLFGAVDELCPVLSYSYERFFGEQASGLIEPFNWDRQTAIMGEGAAFLLLTYDEGATPTYGFIDQLLWTRSDLWAAPSDVALVVGADGHRCYAHAYRRLVEDHPQCMAYTNLYGSLPGGQAFDVAIAVLAAQGGGGPNRFWSAKCDAEGNCGAISCRFGFQPD
jgi:3-oxoacyl-[acyl-carrier-protein] synthase II